MTRFEYRKQLAKLIKKYDYWSKQVKELNNQAIDLFGYHIYFIIQEQVKNKLN